MKSEDWDRLRRLPLFAGLGEDTLAKLCEGSLVQTLPRGTTVCEQGDDADFLHVILSGRVALIAGEANGADKHETVVEFFGPGDAFVLPAVLLELPYLLTARVTEESRLFFLQATKVREAHKARSGLAEGTSLMLARYWRTLINEIAQLKLHSVSQRLVDFLLGLTKQRSGAVTLDLPEDRKVIAQRLGVTPESLSRAFAQLKEIGVGGQGRRVEVADIERLRSLQ